MLLLKNGSCIWESWLKQWIKYISRMSWKIQRNYTSLVVFAIHWHESATGVHVSPVRKWNLDPPVIIWLKIFYDKYIIKSSYSCMHSIKENQRMQKLALKNQKKKKRTTIILFQCFLNQIWHSLVSLLIEYAFHFHYYQSSLNLFIDVYSQSMYQQVNM